MFFLNDDTNDCLIEFWSLVSGRLGQSCWWSPCLTSGAMPAYPTTAIINLSKKKNLWKIIIFSADPDRKIRLRWWWWVHCITRTLQCLVNQPFSYGTQRWATLCDVIHEMKMGVARPIIHRVVVYALSVRKKKMNLNSS